eukprot:1166548-Amorphochlora_amoeboformis.AAC.1
MHRYVNNTLSGPVYCTHTPTSPPKTTSPRLSSPYTRALKEPDGQRQWYSLFLRTERSGERRERWERGKIKGIFLRYSGVVLGVERA